MTIITLNVWLYAKNNKLFSLCIQTTVKILRPACSNMKRKINHTIYRCL